MKYGSLLFFVVAVIAALSIESPSNAQVFPYSAPKAPEFDANGNYVPPGSRSQAVPASVPKAPTVGNRQPARQATRPRAQAISRQPSQNQAPVAPQQGQMPMQRQAAYSGAPGVQQPRQQNSCAQYPMQIMNARSEVEMRQIARYFLTCLMQQGWSQQQAKDQVVRTIESTFKVGRR